MSSQKNPNIPLITNPIGLDARIQELQLKLATLPWLEKSFPLVSVGTTRIENKVLVYPEVYNGLGGNRYYDTMPNKDIKAFSFFRLQDPRIVDDYAPFNYNTYVVKLDNVFWYDLTRIKSHFIISDNHRFNEEVLDSVLTAYRELPSVVVNEVYHDPQNVFRGFNISHIDMEHLKHPYGGFRLVLTTTYQESCG